MIRFRSEAPEGCAGARRGRPGVLLVLAGLLIASGAVRIGNGIGGALAKPSGTVAAPGTAGKDAAAGGDTAAAQPVASESMATGRNEGAVSQGESCTADPGTAAMLASIRERADGLDRREARIADRESAVELAQTAIEARIAALTAAEEALAKTVAMADSAAEEDVARLVAVYENMKPKDAIPVFAEMDPDFAAGFLGRMRADAAAAVLSGLDPKVAYTISAILAGRNANAPVN